MARTQLTEGAWLVQGGQELIPHIERMFESSGVRTKGNPDYLLRSYNHFGIDEARDIRARASTRALSGAGRMFIMLATTLTAEAQNALLKTFEEPVPGTIFVLVVPSPDTLLATVRSRMQRLDIEGAARETDVDVRSFMKADPAKRLDLLKPYLERDDNDERDIRGALSLLAAIERALAEKTNDASAREGLHAVFRARRYIADKGALLKPLLEHVALLVPKL